jgi:deoxyribodipyrimidine photo-lyase
VSNRPPAGAPGGGTPVQLVWFKRDLRVRDHRPLLEAARAGPVLTLYVYEPALLAAADFDGAHLRQINAALAELGDALAERGGTLVTRVGDMPAVLERLAREVPIAALHSHEETTQAVAYARDRAVRRWARARGVPWREVPQTGVVRRLPSRDAWAARWEARMAAPPVAAPERLHGVAVPSEGVLDARALRARGVPVPEDSHPDFRPGGERAARRTLATFLRARGLDYRRAMSSPRTAPGACSRISEHLAAGTLSVRQALHAARAQRATLEAGRRDGEVVDPRWFAALRSFEARLHWHCHFIQKLEDEPALEVRCACAPFERLRTPGAQPERLAAWQLGRTGVPFVDACLRQLRATGWLPFRMRAMVVSYAAWDLWLDWRDLAPWLARQFVDYEPGIHYMQLQMQSGTTGINTLRIYNPWLQGERFDPDGTYIRTWVPELAALPADFIHRPHALPPLVPGMYGVVPGRDYPLPLVDHARAVREAKARVSALRQLPETRRAARRVFERHGSRDRSAGERGLGEPPDGAPAQSPMP